MDFLSKIMPVLWQIVEKKKQCAINVSTVDKKLTITILFGRKKKRFVHADESVMLYELRSFLAA